MRAPDTSPVEEGNPERKGMRNGAARLLPMVLESTAVAPDNSNLPLNKHNFAEVHMKSKKTKNFVVTCQVDLCAESEIRVAVRATKASIACKRAEVQLADKHFQAKAIHCEEVMTE